MTEIVEAVQHDASATSAVLVNLHAKLMLEDAGLDELRAALEDEAQCEWYVVDLDHDRIEPVDAPRASARMGVMLRRRPAGMAAWKPFLNDLGGGLRVSVPGRPPRRGRRPAGAGRHRMPVTVTARLRREQAEQHISDPQRLCALALDTDAGQRDGLPQEAIRPGLHLAPRRSRSPRSARCNPGGEAVGLHAGQPPAAGGPSQIVDVWGRPDVESIPHLQRAAQQRVEESSVVTGEVRDG